MHHLLLSRKTRRGNYYRHRAKLWPSTFEMEMDLSKEVYQAIERTPLALLPGSPQPQRLAHAEGRPLFSIRPSVLVEEGELSQNEGGTGSNLFSHSNVEDKIGLVSDTIEDKIVTEEADLSGTPLSSAKPLRELIPEGDDCANAADSSSTWRSLGLDPLLCQLAGQRLGEKPTRVQSRLMSALLNLEHNDVVMNGVTGSGKTTALALALISAIRSEDAGLNIYVASSAMNGMRMHDCIISLLGAHGGKAVDREKDDVESWISSPSCATNTSTRTEECNAASRTQLVQCVSSLQHQMS